MNLVALSAAGVVTRASYLLAVQKRFLPRLHYLGSAFACVPGLMPECFLTCAINSTTFALPS